MASVSKYVNAFRRIAFASSPLAPYLPIMAETGAHKARRLLADQSNISKHKSMIQIENMIIRGPIPKLQILPPISNLAMAWYFLVFSSILYFYVQMGLVLTYGTQVWDGQLSNGISLFFMILATLILILDIGVRFNSGFLYRGMIVMDRRRIVSKYLRGEFVPDVIAGLILIVVPASQSYYGNYAKLWLVLKLGRLSGMDDLYMRRLYLDRVLKTFYVVFKLMVIIFLLSHAVGLIFYAMDYYFLTTEYYTPVADYCWLVSSTARNNIYKLPWPTQYLYTLYWGVNTITTISYGDIAPLNPYENNFSMVAFCFGFMVYGYVINQVVKIIMWARGHRDQFRQEMIIMETYMDKMSVDSALRTKVREYLYFIYTEEKNRDLEIEAEMKNKLPVDLHESLIRSAYDIFNCKLIGIFNSEAATRFLFHLQERNYTSGETVFSAGERAVSMYYLHRGFIRLELYLSGSALVISETNSHNSMIGQYQLFMKECYPFSCVTNKASCLYILPFEALEQLMHKKTHLGEEYKLLIYEIRHKNNLERILYSCYFCYKFHDFRKCPSRLPQFDIMSLEKEVKSTDSRRFPRRKFETLKGKRIMKDFQHINRSAQKRLVNRIEKRLNRIKALISERDNDFETDAVYDWEIFQPSWNLFRVRDKWNTQLENKREERGRRKMAGGLLSIIKP